MKNFLVFSDLHLNKFPYSNITEDGQNELLISGLKIIDQVYTYALRNNVKYIFFLGDLFHVRAKIDSEIYTNLVYEKLMGYFNGQMSPSPSLILIPGNHDQIDKSGKHTLLPFSSIPDIVVLGNFFKENDFVFCPHQYEPEKLYKYLEENSDKNSVIFMHQLLVNSPTMSGALFKKNEAIDTTRFNFKYLFSGHNHRPFENKKLGVYNVGSPMHYDFGDAECQDRFFIHYSDGEIKWVKTSFPHFAMHGTENAAEASYVKKKSKKVEKTVDRIEINFNDDVNSIAEVYVDSTDTQLDKRRLFEEGCRLLKG